LSLEDNRALTFKGKFSYETDISLLKLNGVLKTAVSFSSKSLRFVGFLATLLLTTYDTSVNVADRQSVIELRNFWKERPCVT
jgi:hypothetical protein